MNRRHFLSLALGTIPLGLATRAFADALDVRLAAIAKARAAVTTMQGPFTQERTIGLMATKIRSTGTMWIERPSRLRWELAAPDSVIYWITPEGLAYKGKNGQGRLPVTERMAPQLEDLRAMLGGDIGSLRTRYDLLEVPAEGGQVAFEATPKLVQNARFQKLAFTLDADLVRP
ncbi:MAG TPA: outer membrane lipoprotein carrier protein LolA, partial [Polyangiaceae bacterium]